MPSMFTPAPGSALASEIYSFLLQMERDKQEEIGYGYRGLSFIGQDQNVITLKDGITTFKITVEAEDNATSDPPASSNG